MKALRRFLRRLFAVKPQGTPRVVRRRLRKYRLERECRRVAYAANWQRRWDEAAVRSDAEAKARRSTYTVVPK